VYFMYYVRTANLFLYKGILEIECSAAFFIPTGSSTYLEGVDIHTTLRESMYILRT